ncbi:Hsp70 protein-domain-containing protein [Melanogaster broomeanus]|nr:Hsp70 protein-domain-containing protein [Melanogaster broomeanus]
MRDISHCPIKVCWERSEADPDEDTELAVFPRGNSVPSTKVLTFYRKGPFDIEARYLKPEGLPGRINPWIATFSTKNVPTDPRGDLTCVKLKTRLNLHGIMSFDSAYVEEVEEREETAPMDVDGEAAPAEAPAKKRRFKEQEAQMHAADKLVQDTEDRKNALEEYVYDTRGKLDDRYAPYVQPAERTKLLGMLQEGEDWLYSEEGEDATKSAYVGKLDALKAVRDPIVARYREAEERPRAIAELRTTLNEYMSKATSSDEKFDDRYTPYVQPAEKTKLLAMLQETPSKRFAHLDPKDKNAVVEKCATIQKWPEDQIARQAERPKNQDGLLKPVGVLKKKDEIIYFGIPIAIPILTKPKPKSDPPKHRHTKRDPDARPGNAIGSLKRSIDRTISDPDLETEKKYLNATLVDVNGTVGAEYLGEKHTFSATQLVAMYFARLCDPASHELKTAVSDVVVPIPGWYTDIQRRAIQDPAAIAGLDALRLISDTTATALSWGITKTDLPDPENPASSSSKALQFKTKYKIDVMSNPKATFRLAVGCERLKKVLSANTEAPLNVESIMNDVDAPSKLSRDEYEQLIAPVLERISGPLEQALAESGLTVDQIDAVEPIGGSTRIPAVHEAIARGATFACAFFSPTFRVREFHMRDISHYPIQVCWERSEGDPDEDTELTVFPRGNSVPSTKVLTFYRKGLFDIEARYVVPEALPGGINPWIATFSTKNVPADPRGDLTRARGDCIDGDAAPAEALAKKRRVKKIDVPFTSLATSLDPAVLEKFKEQEAQMHTTDKLVQDTEDPKNALEEYKTKLLAMLQEGEDWLYSEERQDATKSAYVGKLDVFKTIGDPIVARYREAEERPRAIAELRTTLNEYMSQVTSSDEKFAYLDRKDKNAVVEKCANIQKWLEDQIARQAERPKNQDGVLKPADTTPDPGAKQEKTQEAPPKAEEDIPGPPEMDVD